MLYEWLFFKYPKYTGAEEVWNICLHSQAKPKHKINVCPLALTKSKLNSRFRSVIERKLPHSCICRRSIASSDIEQRRTNWILQNQVARQPSEYSTTCPRIITPQSKQSIMCVWITRWRSSCVNHVCRNFKNTSVFEWLSSEHNEIVTETLSRHDLRKLHTTV